MNNKKLLLKRGKFNIMPTLDVGEPGVVTDNNKARLFIGSVSGNIEIANKEYVDNEIHDKQSSITGAATTITSSDLTKNRALISNNSGKVAVSAVTSTELDYLDGVTSSIQTQLDDKAPTSHEHSIAEVTGLQTALSGKAPTSHTHSAATQSAAGFLSKEDKIKLDGIDDGAQKNVGTDLGISRSGTTNTISSSTGAGRAVIKGATPTQAGLVTTGEQTIKGDKTFDGNTVITGDLTVKGDNFIAETTTVRTEDDLIELRSEGTEPITTPAGIAIKKYDGINDGGIVIKNDGEVRVGKITIGEDGEVSNSDAAQPVLTRAEKTDLIDNDLLVWDSDNNRAITKNLDTLDIASTTTLDSHTEDTSNPHEVTKEQVGLGNVNNTSDLNKPISTATQTALDTKANDDEVVRATTEDKNILGTTEEVFNISEKKVWFNKGALFYGTAAAAGLVTRGISGTTSAGSGKDHLYINYDGTNTLSRQLVLGAGNIGTNRGYGIYDYSAVRGDAFIAYLTNNIQTQIDDVVSSKVDKDGDKGLSTNDYTTTEKNKLAGIASGAEVNVQADWNETTSSSDAYIQNKPDVVVLADVDVDPTNSKIVKRGTDGSASATSFKTGSAEIKYNNTTKSIDFIFS